MRALRGIDVAFLPVNLPYTLSVDKAADAIRQFKPKIVYPLSLPQRRGGEDRSGAAQEACRRAKRRRNPASDWYPSK